MWIFVWDSEPSKIFVGDTPISKVFLWDTQVRPTGWQPWANTLIYLPLNWDALDYSGNGRDGNVFSNWWTYSWEYISWSSGEKYFYSSATNLDYWVWIDWTYMDTAIGTWDRTISIWHKFAAQSDGTPLWMWSKSGWTRWEWFWLYWNFWPKAWIVRYYDDPQTWVLSLDTGWHHYVLTYNNVNKSRMYIDGVLQTFVSNAGASFNTLSNQYHLWALRLYNNNSATYSFSKFIIENIVWSAQDVSDYYNLTKWNYWIS